MSIITDYLKDLESYLNEIPYRLATKVHVENRGDVALLLKGEIVFVDESELHIKEYFISIPVLQKLAYSYHYQDKNKKLIFRFDNAEHYPDVKTNPHHKHIKSQILPSKDMSLKAVVNEVLNMVGKSE